MGKKNRLKEDPERQAKLNQQKQEIQARNEHQKKMQALQVQLDDPDPAQPQTGFTMRQLRDSLMNVRNPLEAYEALHYLPPNWRELPYAYNFYVAGFGFDPSVGLVITTVDVDQGITLPIISLATLRQLLEVPELYKPLPGTLNFHQASYPLERPLPMHMHAPYFEWASPPKDLDLNSVAPETKDYLEAGGLLLRRRTDADPLGLIKDNPLEQDNQDETSIDVQG